VKELSKSPAELRVLVAEDDPINQRLMRMMLERMGYLSATASDGREVLDVLKREHFDVLLLDMRMPVMDGYEVLESLRKRELLPSLQVIAITAGAEEGEEQRILQAGCDGYLAKPVDQEKLAAQLTGIHQEN
jgi:hypothetical protein